MVDLPAPESPVNQATRPVSAQSFPYKLQNCRLQNCRKDWQKEGLAKGRNEPSFLSFLQFCNSAILQFTNGGCGQ